MTGSSDIEPKADIESEGQEPSAVSGGIPEYEVLEPKADSHKIDNGGYGIDTAKEQALLDHGLEAGIAEYTVLEPKEPKGLSKELNAAGIGPEASIDVYKVLEAGTGPEAGIAEYTVLEPEAGIPESEVLELKAGIKPEDPGMEQFPQGAPLCLNGQGLGGTDEDFPGRRQDAEGAGKHNPGTSARPPGQDGIWIIGFWRPALRTCISSLRARSVDSCRQML